MTAQAIDFTFIGSSSVRNNLLINAREDFLNKGELWQLLWSNGVRGFGVYDSFIHIDTLRSEFYDWASAKRKRTYQGDIYATWNSQNRLRYLDPLYSVGPSAPQKSMATPSGEIVSEPVIVEPTITTTITRNAYATLGVVRGWFTGYEDEDRYQTDSKNIVWSAGVILSIVAFAVAMRYFTQTSISSNGRI